MRHTGKAGGKIHPFVVDVQIVCGIRPDIQHDFVVAHILYRYAGMFVYPGNNVRGVAVVVAPFVQGTEQVRFGAAVHSLFSPDDILAAHGFFGRCQCFDKGFALEQAFGVFEQRCSVFP